MMKSLAASLPSRGAALTIVMASLITPSCTPSATPSGEGGEISSGSERSEGASRVVHSGAIAELGMTPPETPWDEMSAFERELYMAGKVTPVMAELFQSANAERYAEFSCETCHGESMREAEFKMPSAELFPLPAPDSRAWAQLEANFPEIMSFMKDEVTPAMGALLGADRYTCMHCHPGAN